MMDLLRGYGSGDDGEDEEGGGSGGSGIEERGKGSDASEVGDKGGPEEATPGEQPPLPAATTTPVLAPPLVPSALRTSTSSAVKAAPAVSLVVGRFGATGAAATGSSLVVKAASASAPLPRRTAAGSGGGDLVVYDNPTKSALYRPSYGPGLDDMDPTGRLAVAAAARGGRRGAKVSASGAAHESGEGYDPSTFHEQRMRFQRDGRALAPFAGGAEAGSMGPGGGSHNEQEVLRTTLGYTRKRLEAFVHKDEEQKAKRRSRPAPGQAKSEPLVHGSDDELEHGIWAPPSAEERYMQEDSLTDVAKVGAEGLDPLQAAEREYLAERDRQRGIREERKVEESAADRLVERKMRHLLPPQLQADAEPAAASTTFHHTEEHDYRGRSWVAPPPGLGGAASASASASADPDHHKCFVPKKCVHRFTDGGGSGNNGKGVHRIRLFPGTGHLLLSAGLDGTCKVWSLELRRLMRTYKGHSAAVRDVQFNRDGARFVSASFDRYLRLWDTETGEVLQTFTNRKVPYCVQFYPKDDNYFVVGCSDSKIVAYDCASGAVAQEYAHHLAPVNAILFVEDHGTKMISSSDDKKILVWEWDIGVPIKYISDPTMHSMPTLALHPSLGYFCGQGLDNAVAVFQASGRFALQRKKRFTGHVVSGYACEMAFSPDGQFLASGDGNGSLFFWDWKRHRILQKFKAHSGGPAAGCAWHPLEPTTVLTCGWDGAIKMWQ